MPKDTQPVYPIGVAAQLCGTHPQTLRTYERVGLISPLRKGSQRMYSNADIDKVRQIQRFTQEMGVNLAGVEIILNLLDRFDSVEAQMEAQMKRQIERVRQEMAEEFRRAENSDKPVPVRRIGLLEAAEDDAQATGRKP